LARSPGCRQRHLVDLWMAGSRRCLGVRSGLDYPLAPLAARPASARVVSTIRSPRDWQDGPRSPNTSPEDSLRSP